MKINDKNLAAFASSGGQVDKEGILMKRGDGSSKGFSKRWFVLKGNLLFYFEKRSDREPIGVIILEGSTVELAETEHEEHFCFKIVFPSRSYVLSAESQASMEQWMKALACASYDYVKLMAAELQRQLDELCRGTENDKEGGGGDTSGNINVHPTPPPRSKIQKNSQKPLNLQNKRSFHELHSEFGSKILIDQEARWSGDLNQNQHVSHSSSKGLAGATGDLQLGGLASLSLPEQETLNF